MERAFPIEQSTSKHPIAVTLKEGVLVLNVLSNRKFASHGFFEKIFSILDAHGIIVDLISTSQVQISMAISCHALTEGVLERAIADLSKYGAIDTSNNLAILSLVGKDMRNSVGIASKMFSTLSRHAINIDMISQGNYYIRIKNRG